MCFKRGKYLRQKCYIEDEIIPQEKYEKGIQSETSYLYSKDKNGFYKMKVTVSGMPDGCYKHVTFDNFKLGASYEGKHQHKIVEGGAVLLDIDFTIKK